MPTLTLGRPEVEPLGADEQLSVHSLAAEVPVAQTYDDEHDDDGDDIDLDDDEYGVPAEDDDPDFDSSEEFDEHEDE